MKAVLGYRILTKDILHQMEADSHTSFPDVKPSEDSEDQLLSNVSSE